MFLTCPMSIFEGCQHQSVANQQSPNLAIPCTKRVMVVHQTLFSLPTYQRKKRSGHTRLRKARLQLALPPPSLLPS